MTGNNAEYIQAYTEIKCLLKYFPINYIKKLPNILLKMIQENSNDKYNIDIDISKNLQSQNLSKRTKDILVVLTYNYWSDENEKVHLRKYLYNNEDIFQKKLCEKYNTDNLFENRTVKEETIDNSVAMMEYKESMFTKIKNLINRILSK